MACKVGTSINRGRYFLSGRGWVKMVLKHDLNISNL